MPESPEDGTRAAPDRATPVTDTFLFGPTAPVPRVVVKADLLPALSAVSLIALLGIPLGWAWASLAPPRTGVVTPNGGITPVLMDNYHAFDAVAIFALLAGAVGVLVGAVAWLVRARRGPILLLAGILGSLAASWMAIQLGGSFAEWQYPVPSRPGPGDVLTMSPETPTGWVLLAQPFAFALCYGLAASWNGRDDLGRRVRHG